MNPPLKYSPCLVRIKYHKTVIHTEYIVTEIYYFISLYADESVKANYLPCSLLAAGAALGRDARRESLAA